MRSTLQDCLHLEAHRIYSAVMEETETFTDIGQRAEFIRGVALSVVVASMHGNRPEMPEMFNTPVFRRLVLTPALRYASGDKIRLEALVFRLGQLLTVREYTERQLAYEAKASHPHLVAV